MLLVEDEDAVRQLTVRILEGYNYQVLHAASGPQALAVAERYPGPIHLLLTDVIMPQMNGRTLTEKLQRARPEMKVLYVSGYSEEIIGCKGVLEDGVAFLAKPFSQDALAAKVREILAGEAGQTGAGA